MRRARGRNPEGEGRALADFALDNGPIRHPDSVTAVRQESPEMHKAFAAHLFEPFELGERISVIVDAQVEVRPFLLTTNHQRGRLLSALVAASRLAGAQRGDQAARKRECGIHCVSRSRVLDDCSAEEHVARERNIVACKMPAPADAGCSGMRGDLASRVDRMNLPMVASGVGGGDLAHNVARAPALFQEPQALGAVKWIDQRLCRDRTNARFDVRNERPHSEETRCNGNSELPGIPIASNDRPGHASHPQPPRSPYQLLCLPPC